MIPLSLSRSTNEALGDVICRLAPFLRLYSHYTSGFEDAIKTLTDCAKRDRKFDALVRDFEVWWCACVRACICVCPDQGTLTGPRGGRIRGSSLYTC